MKRESFKSRLGFILVSAGCAIGIGNVWRFPYVVGENGGGLFVLLYLVFLIAMGLPVLTMEASSENSQFLVFLSVVGMIVLGVSPNFKGSQKVSHCIGAGMSLIFSQIWVGCNAWYWLFLWAGFIAYMAISMSEHWTGNFISDFIKRKPMFWIEVISLLTVYLTCLI